MEMTQVNYQDGDQTLVGKLFRPDSIRADLPAIILFSAFEGPGAFTEHYASKLVERGYIVFAADMYGNGEVGRTLEDCFRLYAPYRNGRELARHRAVLAYEALLKQKNIDTHQLGTLGFCFGGTCALELLRTGASLRAAVCAHTEIAASTLPTETIHASLLILQGYEDPQVPPTRLSAFAEEMETAGVDDWSVMFFSHTKHSFTDPATGTYDPDKEREMGRAYNPVSAHRAFKYAIDFFEENLHSKGE